MKIYQVAIELTSAEASLEVISDVLGIDPDSSSRNKGEIGWGRICERTIWKLESEVDEGADIQEHLASLRAELPLSRLQDRRLPADLTISVDIAVMYDTFTCSIALPNEQIRPFVEIGAGISVACYPTDFSEQSNES